MSLKSQIIKATEEALAIQDSIAEPITYNCVAQSNYDTATGITGRTIASSHQVKKAWFTSFKEREIDGNNVKPSDKRLTIPATAIAFKPKLLDYLIDSEGVVWEVINAKFPPPRVIHILQVRSP